MKSRVVGFVWPPSISTMRPCSTVTASVHESGQSSGHAVSTVEWPQLPKSDSRRMGPLYQRSENKKGHARRGIGRGIGVAFDWTTEELSCTLRRVPLSNKGD